MKYLICNLKAHKTFYEMELYKDGLRTIDFKNIEFILAPSSIYLSLFKNESLKLCTQNLSLNNGLNLTGDICIDGLKSLDVKYALVGHFERRKYYNENEREINIKIKTALENGVKVIYCIGETIEELERKVEYQSLEKQIARILNNISKDDFKNIIIAYEPTYLIGKNEKYDINKIEEKINFIKNLVLNYYQRKIKVIYGGNINLNNIDDFNKIENLDGYIIGNSSLNPANIKKIIEKIHFNIKCLFFRLSSTLLYTNRQNIF